jgi:Na+-driven multidrug efflux pump
VRFSYYYIGAVIVLAAGFLLISQILIHVFVYEKFARSAAYLIWLVLGIGTYNITRSFTGYLYHTGRTKKLGMITVFSALVNIGLAFVLNQINGPVGVAQATFLAFIVHTVLIMAFALRAYPMPWLHPLRQT